MQNSSNNSPQRSKFKQTLLVSAGFLAVALGFLGMFLPVLPTTPFLLVAAACFSRSSDRFHHWLLNHRWFGPYIGNYIAGRGMTLRQKVTTISLLWATLLPTALFLVPVVWVKLLLMVIATAVSVHLGRLKRAEPDGESTVLSTASKSEFKPLKFPSKP